MKPKKEPTRALRRTDDETSFREVVGLIEQAREHALRTVNTALIDLYWQVGEYISRKLESAVWGEGVVDRLAQFITREHSDIKGFTRRSLFRMRQFYETYRGDKKVAPLVRHLSWTHNLMILGRCKRPEEREFYLRLCSKERWSSRELDRQLSRALFERAILSPPKVSALLTQLHPESPAIFKDTYLLDFLDLPDGYSEADLQSGLVANLRKFPTENRWVEPFGPCDQHSVRTILRCDIEDVPKTCIAMPKTNVKRPSLLNQS